MMVRALATDNQLCELVSSYLVNMMVSHRSYHAMFAFWSSTSIWVMVSMKENRINEEEIVGRFLPHVSNVLPLKKDSDAQVAAYMILAVMASQFFLALEVRKSAAYTVASSWTKSSFRSGLACITQLVNVEEYDSIDIKVWNALEKIKSAPQEIIKLAETYDIGRFVVLWSAAVIQYSPENIEILQEVLLSVKLHRAQVESIVKLLIKIALEPLKDENMKQRLVTLYESFLESTSLRDSMVNSLESLGLSLEKLELSLQSSINSGVVAKPDEVLSEPDAIVAEDKNAIVSLNESLSSLKQSDTPSYLCSGADEEFFKLGELFTTAVASRANNDKILEELKIGKDAQITFLARLWCGPVATVARITALRLFIDIVKDDRSTDFQAIVPCLLLGLLCKSEKIRRFAASAISTVATRYPMKRPTVWGIKTVYGIGQDTDEVKWFSTQETDTLLNKIIGPKLQECVLDSEYLYQVLNEIYSQRDYKSFSSTFSTFLSSHAIAVQIPCCKSGFLRIQNKTGKNNSKYLGVLLDDWLDKRESWKEKCADERFSFDELELEVISSISVGDKSTFKFLEKCLHISSADKLITAAAEKIVKLWDSSKHDAQLTVVRLLIDVAVDEKIGFDAFSVLSDITISSLVFLTLLKDCKLEASTVNSGNNSPSLAKRRRRSSASSRQLLQTGTPLAGYAERHLRKLTIVLELLEKDVQSANAELLPELFAILNEVLCLGTDSNLSVSYTQQVIASCMIMVVDELKKKRTVKLDSNAVRVDILVACIRNSVSPQVQNRFLLLIASLASLAPEIVLHSVMPIFTFMGANTLRQDDEFSTHVIEQTVSKVVPALTAEGASREEEINFLLLSFVAAFLHVPRHRRIRLFSSLIMTLGTETSLCKLLMLLGLKYSESKRKYKQGEANSFLQFAEMFCKSLEGTEHVKSIYNYLTLVDQIPWTADYEEKSSAFLNSQLFSSLVNFNTESLVTLKSDLYEFVSGTITMDESQKSLRLRVLVEISVSKGSKISKEIQNASSQIIENLLRARTLVASNDSLSEPIFSLLEKVLDILPIQSFVDMSHALLKESGEVTVKRHVLALIRSKLALELSTNTDVQTAASNAVQVLAEFLHDQSLPPVLIQLSLDGLEAIVTRFGKSSDDVLLKAVLDIAVGTNGFLHGNANVFVSAVAVVNSACLIMGAKIIAYFAKIIPVAVERFERCLEQDMSDDEVDMIQLAILALIAGFVKRIPAFMTSSLNKILELVFKSTAGLEQRRVLLDNLITNMESKDLIISLSVTWKYATQSGFDAIALHLESVDTVINLSSKKDVSSQSSGLVKFLLEAFEVRASGKFDVNTCNKIETKIVNTGTQFVLKLNDKTFRPLFTAMVRWAVDGDNTSVSELSRLLVFFKFYAKLLHSLKSIITNYYGYVLDPACEILGKYTKLVKASNDAGENRVRMALLRSILNSLIISFQNSEGEFWQSQARFEKISDCLINLIPDIEGSLGSILVKAIVILAENTSSSADNNEFVNNRLSSHIKTDCSKNEKLLAVKAFTGLYEKAGDEWNSLLPQLLPLISELLEDDEESIELAVRTELIPAIEKSIGESVDRYLS